MGVTPYWEGIRDHLESVRDARGRISITKGIDALLSTLQPKVQWKQPVLEVPADEDQEVHLGGRGLLLSPSLFLFGRSSVLVGAERETGLPALVFSAPVTPSVVAESLGLSTPKEPALGALVGHTRAAALRALAETCTTGELSERLGISLAGASKQATVLRRAGLVTTQRSRNKTLHTLTSLGLALLDSRRFISTSRGSRPEETVAVSDIRKASVTV